jgi:hypothetical protein
LDLRWGKRGARKEVAKWIQIDRGRRGYIDFYLG